MRNLSGFSLFFIVLPGLAVAHPGDHSPMSVSGLMTHLVHDPFHLATVALAMVGLAGLVTVLAKDRR